MRRIFRIRIRNIDYRIGVIFVWTYFLLNIPAGGRGVGRKVKKIRRKNLINKMNGDLCWIALPIKTKYSHLGKHLLVVYFHWKIKFVFKFCQGLVLKTNVQSYRFYTLKSKLQYRMNKLAQIYNQFLDTVSRQHEENNSWAFCGCQTKSFIWIFWGQQPDERDSIIENPLVQ